MDVNQWKRTVFPNQFQSDSKQIIQLCIPYIFSYVMENLLMPTVSIIFMGWIGQSEFNACASAQILYRLFAYVGYFGLTYACDTLFSQAYGGNKYQMGTIIQRAILIGINATVIIWILLINIQYFVPMVVDNEHTARLINIYLSFSMIMVPIEALSILLQKFLINHGVTWPLLAINTIGNIINIITHYILLYILKFGVEVPPIAFSCAYLAMVLSCLIYLYLSSIAKNTWHPWTRDCLREWSIYLKLGIPGIIISFIQALVYGGPVLLATIFGTDAVTAQGVVYYVDYFIFLISLAFTVSSTVVLGRYLGAGSYENAEQMKRTIYIIIWIFIIPTVLGGLAMVYWIPYLFHTPQSAQQQTRYLLSIVIIFCAFDFYHLTQASILRACGQQYFDALVSFSSYFFVGVPFGILFIFALHLQMAGYWFALLLSLFLTNIIFFIYIRKINWKEQVERAQVLISNRIDINERSPVLLNDEQNTELSLFDLMKTKLIVFIILFLIFLFSCGFLYVFRT